MDAAHIATGNTKLIVLSMILIPPLGEDCGEILSYCSQVSICSTCSQNSLPPNGTKWPSALLVSSFKHCPSIGRYLDMYVPAMDVIELSEAALSLRLAQSPPPWSYCTAFAARLATLSELLLQLLEADSTDWFSET